MLYIQAIYEFNQDILIQPCRQSHRRSLFVHKANKMRKQILAIVFSYHLVNITTCVTLRLNQYSGSCIFISSLIFTGP